MSKTFEEMIDEIAENMKTLEEETAKEACELFGLVGLPRDADDEPIHIGDLVALGDNAFYVDEMYLFKGGECGCFWKVFNGAGDYFVPMALRHVHEDTIEGIMIEAVKRAHCDTLAKKDGTDITDLLERLRDLMGDSDER